ncbi:MAG: type I-U CRISPR-associated helicase/endonuclease Cas3 [Phycisphaerae bacterium]|nr:type I-U CRISPR-associated helicase/endonuclease Cas3 [Phycisphaerae bacterium]
MTTNRHTVSFAICFEALTGYAPLCWQKRLFDRLANGSVPPVVDLPTGLGKTSVIPIWLIALAQPAPRNNRWPRLPRRLVYIVNRRTVVDQATDDAKRLLGCIYRSGQLEPLSWATAKAITALGLNAEPAIPKQQAPIVATLRKALADLSADDTAAPLAVSTLRGELADNGEWKVNPARPAIIIGTIDMIGSKLLFSGYGDERYGRAHHAGLIGQDALIVHDEAHLSPAFDALLASTEVEQKRTKEARPVHVMRLSATTRADGNAGKSREQHLTIEGDDYADGIVSQRLNAKKTLRFTDAEKDKDVHCIVGVAVKLGEERQRVLVYVRSPETAQEVVKGLRKKLGDGSDGRVGLLTGTIRGYERDQLAESDLFRAFRSDPNRPRQLAQTLYLVSTSAGEVGADWDADQLVCDLSTLDSMAQRFGRVNRLGGDGRSAQIVVVMEKSAAKRAKSGDDTEDGGKDEAARQGNKKAPNAYEAAVLKTGEILRRVVADGGDVSPARLRKVMDSLSNEDRQAAFSPTPKILPATDILFDHWSLTSIAGELPGRPEVGPYLHGVAEWEPPETHVAWRADIALLARAGGKDEQGADLPCSAAELEQVFDVFPLRAVEQLRDRTDRVLDELSKIAKRQPGQRVVVMKAGMVRWATLEELIAATDTKRLASSPLAFATLVMPTEVGGLSSNGTLRGDQAAPSNPDDPNAHRRLDVAESASPSGSDGRDRQRVQVGAIGPESVAEVGEDESEPETEDGATGTNERALVGAPVVPGFVRRLAVPLSKDESDDGVEPATIEYRLARGQAREPGKCVQLRTHNDAVAAAAERMASALGLPDDIKKAVSLAGRMHDLGKGREVWQRYANNPPPRPVSDEWLAARIAKSDKYGHWKALRGYRHEFGSLHDAAADDEIRSLDSDTRDLALHLIAAHHGWARPHFEPRHFDPGDSDAPRPTTENEKAAVESMQRFGRLQQRYGRWGLAWLESILRCADAAASESSTGGAGVPPAASATSDGAVPAHDGAGGPKAGGAA